jgi:glycosyltransferase involved in cell wall biosynthesis
MPREAAIVGGGFTDVRAATPDRDLVVREPRAGVPRATATEQPWLLVSAAFVKTGGQDRANFALASYLARHGYPLHLVSHRVAGEIGSSAHVHLHAAPHPLGWDLLGEPFLQQMGHSWARRLADARVVANGGNCAWPDVNWVHYVHAAYAPGHEGGVARRTKQKLAHRLFLHDERRALRSARVVIANSRRTARDLIERVGVSADRIRVVYYGIDADEFRPGTVAERSQTRADLGWPTERPVVLFIGALGDKRKGFDTLFAAWQRLSRISRFDPLLVVIGRGAMLTEWQRRAIDEGLAGSMTFLGFRDDVPRLVRAADLLVAPTRYEAYGLGVHEALCCGLPAVVSSDAGVAERYPDGLLDLLLPHADDADDLAERIDRSLDDHAGLLTRMQPFSAQLRARTWDDMAHDIVHTVAA